MTKYQANVIFDVTSELYSVKLEDELRKLIRSAKKLSAENNANYTSLCKLASAHGRQLAHKNKVVAFLCKCEQNKTWISIKGGYKNLLKSLTVGGIVRIGRCY